MLTQLFVNFIIPLKKFFFEQPTYAFILPLSKQSHILGFLCNYIQIEQLINLMECLCFYSTNKINRMGTPFRINFFSNWLVRVAVNLTDSNQIWFYVHTSLWCLKISWHQPFVSKLFPLLQILPARPLHVICYNLFPLLPECGKMLPFSVCFQFTGSKLAARRQF